MTKPLSEGTREREAFKYHQSVSNITYNDRPVLLPNSQLSTSGDVVLTALAQLGVHRTNTSRSFVSLFDARWQYFVAEATASLPLGTKLGHAERDGEELWLCGTGTPRSSTVCDSVLSPHISKCYAPSPLSVTLINDLQNAERSPKDLRHGVASTPAQFYAAVPIKTARGIDIGVFCVVHTEPLDTDPDRKAKLGTILSEISRAIMSHLETERMKLEHRRTQRMVRGVGSFVEKAATLTDWQEGPNPSAFQNVIGMEGALNERQQALQPERRYSSGADISPEQGLSQDSPESSKIRDEVAAKAPFALRTRSRSSSQEPTDIPAPIQQGGLYDIFSRAANLIRESIEVEGVVFLDADNGSFGSRMDQPRAEASSLSSSVAASSSDEAHSGHESGDIDDCCPVLGFATSDKSSINNDKAARTQVTLPGKLLSTLLRRYPSGKIWNFDEHGALQSSDSSEDDSVVAFTPALIQKIIPRKPDLKAKPWARQREGSTVSAIFPGARSVAFTPAWNEKTGRWHSGCFAYTFTPTRILTVAGELSYLRAFGVLAIAEVARMEAGLEVKARNDILNSISHELRSPLHGVVLGVELLQDTGLDTFQGNIVHTVETCGRTLLDTIDHLLDVTKINNFLRNDKKERQLQRRTGRPTIETGMKNLLVEVSLDAIVEEVVESVFAGHNFQRFSIGELGHDGTTPKDAKHGNRRLDYMKSMEELGRTPRDHEAMAPPNDAVRIHLDIEPGIHRYLTTVGAVRRIVMNLFGNALKYTQKGAITVSLSRVSSSARKYRGRQHTVQLIVSDSGQGMAEDYINNRLFKAFHQEDELSPGTGLGLSLVKGIVDSLNGQISVRSKVDVGTTVTVLLPLKAIDELPSGDISDKHDSSFIEQLDQLRGLRVNPNDLTSTQSTVGVDLIGSQQPPPCTSVEAVCRDWLKMEVVKGGLSYPDVNICSEAVIDDPQGLSRINGKAPIVVICRDAVEAHSRTITSQGLLAGRVVEFISQPAGPRKLAKILLLAIKRWIDLQGIQTPINEFVLTSTSPWTAPATPCASEDWTPVFDGPVVTSRPKRGDSPISPATTSSPPLPDTPPRDEKSPEFLLVDDNPVNLKILCAFMQKLGRTYGTASDGAEAVARFKASPNGFKCIFMDISMPRLDGMAATRQIRQYERESEKNASRATIIALTGLASAAMQKEAYESGMNLFLTKPVMLKELKDILSNEKYI